MCQLLRVEAHILVRWVCVCEYVVSLSCCHFVEQTNKWRTSSHSIGQMCRQAICHLVIYVAVRDFELGRLHPRRTATSRLLSPTLYTLGVPVTF